MQHKPKLRYKFLLSIFIGTVSINIANGQITSSTIDWTIDTVAGDIARKGLAKFKSDMANANRKSSTTITMPVAKLNEVLNKLASKGIPNVTFIIATIRKEDTAHYAKHVPGLTPAYRNDLIGRQQIIIKVPKAAFETQTQSGSRIPIRTSSLMTSLLLMGLIQWENEYYAAEDVYFTFGTICPPPAACTD